MKIISKIDNVKSDLWKIDCNIVIQKKDSLINLVTEKEFYYENEVIRCFYSNDYIFTIREEEINILNSDFSVLNFIKYSKATGISIFSVNDYAIWFENENEDEFFNLYLNNKSKGISESFFGKFLNSNYSYRFKNRRNRESFRLSSLLNDKDFFEFQCTTDEEIVGEIIKHEERILFYTKENAKELYDSKFWINVLDIKTGDIIYKILVEHYGASFDYEKGQFVSIQGSNQNKEIIKRYEIVDVNNGKLEKGNFHFSEEMHAVGTAVQCIDNNKLYFVDNIYSYEEEKRTGGHTPHYLRISGGHWRQHYV